MRKKRGKKKEEAIQKECKEKKLHPPFLEKESEGLRYTPKLSEKRVPIKFLHLFLVGVSESL